MQTVLTTFITILLFPILSLCLSHGFGVCGLINKTGPLRISVALIFGLALLIWNISVINLWFPLGFISSLICLWPILGLIKSTFREELIEDIKTMFSMRQGVISISFFTIIFILLSPLFFHWNVITFDATPNHDSFFWVTAASCLQQHSYLISPNSDALHPAMASVPAITGWKPLWGRMAGEGLLAFWSSLLNCSPVHLLIPLSASLLFAWLASCYLILRTFFRDKFPSWSISMLVVFQPVFYFAHFNSNLPNLIGSIFGVVVITSSASFFNNRKGGWISLILNTFSFHCVLSGYPEMIPFVIIPSGLLWLRFLFKHKENTKLRKSGLFLFSFTCGLLVNPVSSFRAYHGFIESFVSGRADAHWNNMFDRLTPAEFIPGLITLNPWFCRTLGWVLGCILTLLFVYGFYKTFRQAKDPVGAVLATSGGLILLVYTIVTDFSYGWQKSIQFSGPIISSWTLATIIGYGDTARQLILIPNRRKWAYVNVVAVVILLVFMSFTTIEFIKKEWKMYDVKNLTTDYPKALNFLKQKGLSDKLLVFKSGSFSSPFYHSMWAPYFFRTQKIAFTSRYPNAAGYNCFQKTFETDVTDIPRAAYVISNQWFNAWEANVEPLWKGKQLVILEKSNILHSLVGFYPLWGVSKYMNQNSSFEITPCQDSLLILDLKKSDKESPISRSWIVTINNLDSPDGDVKVIRSEFKKSPWTLKIPLVKGQRQHVEIKTDVLPELDPMPPFPFVIKKILMMESHHLNYKSID